MAVALGLAEMLSKMRGEIRGTVKFLFQPAEEGPPMGEEGGAPLMIKEGALENPKVEAVFGLHVSTVQEAGTVGYVSGPALSSSDTFRIKLKGKKSHGAFPHEGNDAIQMATTCIQGLYGLKARRIDAQQPVVLGIGTVHGGDRFNVVAEEVTLEGTLRTFDQKTREEVRTRIREVLAGCTAMQGGSFELAYRGDGNPSVFNDPKLTAASVPHLERALGKPNAILVKPAMVSEDFSYYQLRVPGFFFWLGVGNQARGITAGLHTAEMDLDEDALPVGVKAAAAVLLGYLDGR
jgi:amidohydrolase